MDLGIRDISAEVRLWVQLVFMLPVTPGRAEAHGNNRIFSGRAKGKASSERLFVCLFVCFSWQHYAARGILVR